MAGISEEIICPINSDQSEHIAVSIGVSVSTLGHLPKTDEVVQEVCPTDEHWEEYAEQNGDGSSRKTYLILTWSIFKTL